MLTRRILACLDVDAGRVVKGTRFLDLADRGEPVELAARYEAQGADEIVFLDISATPTGRSTVLEQVRLTASRLSVPLTLGGGIRTVADAAQALRAGADKVSVNTAAVDRPELMTEMRDRFGAQCTVASIDARREPAAPGAPPRWIVVTRGGRTATTLDAVQWAAECVRRGAGEILLTSVDADGTRRGYDEALVRAVSDAVGVPVIASGGAGEAAHLVQALEAGADAVLVAGMLHDGTTTVTELKRQLTARGCLMRMSPASPEAA